jgi:serine/threonine-protein kinase
MPILTPEERVGTTIADKYELQGVLGRGGMGVVYRAHHAWTGRPVAIKLLHHDDERDPEVARRFLQEARAATALGHPNVVDVLDMGKEPDGTVYLVLELLAGESLGSLLAREERLAPERMLELLLPVAGALIAAHERGVIHRDLKPDNIFVSKGPMGRIVPKVLDFGIARVVASDGASSTRTGTVLGTPNYMSPEQARGEPDVGPASDVWSLAVVMYRCLSGTLPFDAHGANAMVVAIATQAPIPLSVRAPEVPLHLARAIDAALVPDRARRLRNMRELVDALLRGANDSNLRVVPITIPPPPEPGTPSVGAGVHLAPTLPGIESTSAPTTGDRPAHRAAALTPEDSGMRASGVPTKAGPIVPIEHHVDRSPELEPARESSGSSVSLPQRSRAGLVVGAVAAVALAALTAGRLAYGGDAETPTGASDTTTARAGAATPARTPLATADAGASHEGGSAPVATSAAGETLALAADADVPRTEEPHRPRPRDRAGEPPGPARDAGTRTGTDGPARAREQGRGTTSMRIEEVRTEW